MRRLTAIVALAAALAIAAGCGSSSGSDGSSTKATTTTSAAGATTAASGGSTATTAAPTTAGPTTTADSSAGSISKADFVKQANAICDDGNAALQSGAEGIDSSDPTAVANYLKSTFVPGVRGQITKIETLGYPAGDEASLKKTFDQTDAILDKIAADPATYAAATDDPFSAVDPALDAYGLTSCGTGGV